MHRLGWRAKPRYPDEVASHVMTHLMNIPFFPEFVSSRDLDVGQKSICISDLLQRHDRPAGEISAPDGVIPSPHSHRQRNLGMAPGDDIRVRGPSRRFWTDQRRRSGRISGPSPFASSQMSCPAPQALAHASCKPSCTPPPYGLAPPAVKIIRTRKCGGRGRASAGMDKLTDPPFRPFFVGGRDQGMKGEAEGVGGRVRWLGLEAHRGGEQGSVQGGVCGSTTVLLSRAGIPRVGRLGVCIAPSMAILVAGRKGGRDDRVLILRG